VRLFEHPEFEQVIVRAARHFHTSEQFVEKDYYVTEILRIVSNEFGGQTVFKGGTSLSKGWGLITRFSEDIDLFVNPDEFEQRPGTNKMNRLLKQLSERVADHPALTWLDEGDTIGGLGREDYFQYETRFASLPGIRPAVRLEPGIASGTFPTESMPIVSVVGRYLLEQGRGDFAEDTTGFEMRLLHYRRTFVEKMFAIHGKVVRLQQEGHELSRDARHYADLYVLAGKDDVRAMLASPEYLAIREDYDAISRKFFSRIYRPPNGVTFKESPAFFPDPGLRDYLRRDYERECHLLFSGQQFPTFNDVLARFEGIREIV
jgi:hypothetical protein